MNNENENEILKGLIPEKHGTEVTVVMPNYTAEIHIGNGLIIQLRDITFTKRQIKHIKKYFGWEVINCGQKENN